MSIASIYFCSMCMLIISAKCKPYNFAKFLKYKILIKTNATPTLYTLS